MNPTQVTARQPRRVRVKGSIEQAVFDKVKDFQRRQGGRLGPKSEGNFTVEQFRERFADNERCYLTGRPVNIDDPDGYRLDHIMASSRGGPNTLDNCGMVCPEANDAKDNLTVDELLELCEDILTNFGYEVFSPREHWA